jgi:hypothetical protein
MHETIRETYFKVKWQCIEQGGKAAKFHYTQDVDGVIRVMQCYNIVFEGRSDEENIRKLTIVSHRAGFMFFNNSAQGMTWINSNSLAITDAFWNATSFLHKFGKKPANNNMLL